jgi:hypothetical protein
LILIENTTVVHGLCFRLEECDRETIDSLRDSANNVPGDNTSTEDKRQATSPAMTSDARLNHRSANNTRAATTDDRLQQQSNDITTTECGTGDADYLKPASRPNSPRAPASDGLPLIVIDEYRDDVSDNAGEGGRSTAACLDELCGSPVADVALATEAGSQRSDALPETRGANCDEGTYVDGKGGVQTFLLLREQRRFSACARPQKLIDPHNVVAKDTHWRWQLPVLWRLL